MNLILVDEEAFAANLNISAELTSVRTTGASKPPWSSSTASPSSLLYDRADDHPVGLHEVSNRRALFEELGIRDETDGSRPRSLIVSRTFSPVPTGTVYFITTSRWRVAGQIALDRETADRSAAPA